MRVENYKNDLSKVDLSQDCVFVSTTSSLGRQRNYEGFENNTGLYAFGQLSFLKQKK